VVISEFKKFKRFLSLEAKLDRLNGNWLQILLEKSKLESIPKSNLNHNCVSGYLDLYEGEQKILHNRNLAQRANFGKFEPWNQCGERSII